MLKDKLNIIDILFSHAKSSSWYNEPKKFDWERNSDSNTLIFTDLSLFSSHNYDVQKKYAWLLESPEITPSSYEYIKNNFNLFDGIFTFDKELLSMDNKFTFVPCGGCWIDDIDKGLHRKTKMISMLSSSKNSTEAHKLRHRIINELSGVDYYGFMNPIDKKITSLRDYRFSIIVENTKKDYYFTEKIIDCFMTGTIPIYYGCPSIGDFFDDFGIITFDTISELKEIISELSTDDYNKRINSVQKNYEEAKKYLVADDIIYEKIKKYESN